jgi:hypothetical protein
MAESSRETMTESQRPEVDIGLVKAAKGDPRAFAELYQSFVEPVFRYLYSRTGNVHDAEDATAQTFLVAFETIASLRQEEHLASWLFSIARHKVMDQYRTQKRIVSIDFVAEITTEKDPLSEVIRSEQSATLAQLIAALKMNASCCGCVFWPRSVFRKWPGSCAVTKRRSRNHFTACWPDCTTRWR